MKILEQLCEICPKLTIKTPERCHCHRFGVFTVKLEQISYIFIYFIVDFEQVNADWDVSIADFKYSTFYMITFLTFRWCRLTANL